MLHSLLSTAWQRCASAATRHPYAGISVMIAGATALGLLVQGVLYPANLDALFLLVVFVSALKWGRRPALFAASAGAVVFDFCFIPPRFSFSVSDLPYFVTLIVFVIIAVTTSELASRAHDLLREQSARARAEAVVHAKDALLNRIAHELRQPLTPIRAWVQILRLSGGDAQRTARGVAGLERNAELLARLVDDLLDASRIHVGKLCVQRKRITLAPLIERSLEDATIAAAEKGVTLQCAVEPVGTVLADEHRIEQVIGNLVSNALKFTPADGRITVSLSKAGAVARLVVADSGEGIARDFIPQVFEAFSQANARASGHTSGLGLGLAIVKHLVDAHEGRISVESDGPGQGTTFVVELPLENPFSETATIQDTERTGDVVRTTNGTVLH
jgi:K+-sensing histidine kinase KdpD